MFGDFGVIGPNGEVLDWLVGEKRAEKTFYFAPVGSKLVRQDKATMNIVETIKTKK